ncbi:gephyrin-like molybdotransferase Glp [Thalassobius sp. I31.1]|uniref:molybdopterin molybdotransferase MoeA n=1 Tax=Thalassobius sp. I31.1 TaxID=2109912 RepID=UPI000D1B0D04|nr:gephyrin-like molybdotransferase Glp [Thalassobius sp. I31.1]
MISVSEALDACFALISPLNSEVVDLKDAAGRTLIAHHQATRNQPPFAASAMDGYAMKSVELQPQAQFMVVGESAAGARYTGKVRAGQCVRIFTGAPMPEGCDHVVIQEDTTRQGNVITLNTEIEDKANIRPAGNDFDAGFTMDGPRVLTPGNIALLAAMNQPKITVTRKPVIAIMATGDELVQPGETPNEDQIIASNGYGLKALLEANGADVRLLPIARDTEASLRQGFELCAGADLIVTLGGASVGDHDLVRPVATSMGMEPAFYKVAMRPGKPLMAGKIGDTPMIGLPGNPVSSMVCAQIFILPMLRHMLGFNTEPMARKTAPLFEDLRSNGPREHYMRATLRDGKLTVHKRQDSSLLSVYADANALVVVPPFTDAQPAGTPVEYIDI